MATEALSAERLEGRRSGAGTAAAGTLALALGYLKEAAAQEGVPAANLMRRAALHGLNRLNYGPRPGDIDRVLDVGLERWVDDQFKVVPDADLERRLASHNYLYWSMADTWRYYQIDQETRRDTDRSNDTNYIGTLHQQLRSAQIVRSVHSKNQLLEVMTWFWFNHFNVNLADDYVSYSAHDYEKEIRQRAFGKFKDLLSMTAHHPAMMSYLDNYLSKKSRTVGGRLVAGLNENYGRELLELHTVGVDAGYSQNHVYNAATVLTGWGLGPGNGAAGKVQGRFMFTRAEHDEQATEVFGLRIPAGLYQESGEMLLDYLSTHPKTAEFISTKLVRHFVNDDPPPRLVAAATARFLATDGDIEQVLRTIFTSKEFWAEAFGAGKYKNPFQYVVSTLRAVDADVQSANSLSGLLNNMGQPQYGCIPPTGWSDKGREWVNPSSHMYRMNFALDLVTISNTQPFGGIFVDVPRLLRNHRIDPNNASHVAGFFNREIYGGNLSPRTLSTLSSFNSTGTVSMAHRITGLVLAGPEAQGR